MSHNFVQIVRFTLGFSWVYQGVFPKLIHIAPLEWQMSQSFGLSEEATVILIHLAGIGEILFGITLILFYRNRMLLLFNIFCLIALFLFVLVQTPAILIEAFNPVTTNLPLIVLSFYLFEKMKKH